MTSKKSPILEYESAHIAYEKHMAASADKA